MRPGGSHRYLLILATLGASLARASEIDVLALLREPGAIERALDDQEPIRGHFESETLAKGRTPFCHAGRRARLSWEFRLAGVKTDLDDHGNTTIELILARTDMYGLAHGRDGVFCRWGGGEGRIELGEVKLFMHLVPMSEDRFPGVSVDGLQLDDLDLSRVRIGWPGIFYPRWNTPRWFDRWIEGNLNVMLRRFFAGDTKKKLDAYLTAELAKRMGNQHGLDNPPPPLALAP